MLSSKERANLRKYANSQDTIIHIGKDGVTENVIRQADSALTARELIKGRVLPNSLLTAREASDEVAQAVSAETVFTVGSKFVLFRRNRAKKDSEYKAFGSFS
ncbi:MAG: YhbY family RNA-binding protein [Oscillospiraceae bacterium]|jgi:RNA-binding protein|nr:YhbY family RNA-binding protein [Oscillospiraceae bacterium]